MSDSTVKDDYGDEAKQEALVEKPGLRGVGSLLPLLALLALAIPGQEEKIEEDDVDKK